MEKTVIQQALSHFDEMVSYSHDQIKDYLQSLLSKEKEQLEKSFDAGYSRGKDDGEAILNEDTSPNPEPDFLDYYNQTYGNKDNSGENS